MLALVLVLAGGAAVTGWLSRDAGGSALDGRPRITDDKAGLSYALPEGWEHADGEDLIPAFSSVISDAERETAGDDEDGATVLTGSAGAIPQSDLKRETERAARANAAFFFPNGSSTPQNSQPTTVSDRPAHTVVLRVEDGKGGIGHLRITIVSVDDERSAFLLGIALPAESSARERVDEVLESAELI